MTATYLLVLAIFAGLTRKEIVGIDLALLIVLAIMIWVRCVANTDDGTPLLSSMDS